ncbi:MAG TPA: hypothetical protein VKG65_00085, partial [Terriglobales bacterium]|nr:hypothetical protein [Terriglobales bacterium]
MGKRAFERFPSYQLQETLDLIDPPLDGTVSAITRRHLIDKLSNMGDLAGQMHITEFLSRILPLSQIPFNGGRLDHTTHEDGVQQHMVRNDDWTYKDFFDYANVIHLSERRFRSILEQIVHPEVRTGDQQKRFVDAINPSRIVGSQYLWTSVSSGNVLSSSAASFSAAAVSPARARAKPAIARTSR